METVYGPTGLRTLAIPVGYVLGSRTIVTTTGSHTYTPPAGCQLLLVECIAAGGSGEPANAASSGQISVGSGGAGGGYAACVVAVPPNTIFTSIVAAGPTSGLNGSNTQFTRIDGVVLCSAQAGATGGVIATGITEAFVIGGVAAGTAGVGNVVIPPTFGGVAHRISGTVATSGAGGSSRYGGGGAAVMAQSVGNAGGKYGGGGSGGMSVNAGGSAAGGSGGQGVIIVWEFY